MFLLKKKKNQKKIIKEIKKKSIKLPNIDIVSKNFANNIFNEININNIPYDEIDELIRDLFNDQVYNDDKLYK